VALSDDQRALLRLLAQREEGYEDIAALTGQSVAEVRAKVRGALEELEAQDETQATGGAPAAGPVAAGNPPPPAAAEASSGTVPPAAPPADEAPPPPAAARSSSPAPRRPRERGAHGTKPALPRSRRRLAELIGGAVVVLLLILFATGTIDLGGDDDDGGDGGPVPGRIPTEATREATQAVLRGVGGGDASGRALFGRDKQQVILILAAKGLDPTPSGRSYAISLVRSGGERIPIAATQVGESGTVTGQFQLPSNVLGLLATGYDEMEVSLVVNKELETALAQARRDQSAPAFGGTDVLRGPVTGPVVNAAAEEDG
jgi:hypothetical protein